LQKPKVCAVSFLNTAPLVYGLAHGPQRDAVELQFAVPSECARRVEAGAADVGLVPVIEMQRQGLTGVPSVGIACRGPVRSILLLSKVPFGAIRTLAGDANSRTSIELARIILARRYGAEPAVHPLPPNLDAMLARADAALLIGDSALAVDRDRVDLRVLDLGAEWFEMCALPFVFALWAGPAEKLTPELAGLLEASCLCGLSHMDRIIEEESARRPLPRGLIERYLTGHIVYRLGDREREGLALYLRYARQMDDLVLTAGRLHGEAQR
jgi:predicted solute-binding protein